MKEREERNIDLVIKNEEQSEELELISKRLSNVVEEFDREKLVWERNLEKLKREKERNAEYFKELIKKLPSESLIGSDFDFSDGDLAVFENLSDFS